MNDFSGTTAVDNWLIRLAIWVAGGLVIGGAGTVSALVWAALVFGFDHEQRLASLERDSKNHMSAYTNIDATTRRMEADLAEMKGDVKVLKARLP